MADDTTVWFAGFDWGSEQVAGHKGQPEQVAERGGSDGAADLAGAPSRGTQENDKPHILGRIQRGGQAMLHMLADVQQKTIKPIITAAVAPGTLVHADEHGIYACLPSRNPTRATWVRVPTPACVVRRQGF